MNGETNITNRNEKRTGGISRRRAGHANFGCERCGLLIAADSFYFLLSSSVSRVTAAERFHEACIERQTNSIETEIYTGGKMNERR